MNRNQLKKLLENKNDQYSNLPRYMDILDEASLIKLDLHNLRNAKIMATLFDQAVIAAKPVEIPFDNILLDVRNLTIGDAVIKNASIHIYPTALKFGEHDIIVSIVNLFMGPDLNYRPYLVYADARGIHTMPAYRKDDKSDCDCYKQNAFCNSPRHWMEIISRTPAYLNDVGFCIPECKNFTCKPSNSVSIVSKAVRAILAYMSMPRFYILKVTSNDKYGPYYIYVNDSQYDRLVIDGDHTVETTQEVIDGANILQFLDEPSISTVEHTFIVGDKRYEVVQK